MRLEVVLVEPEIPQNTGNIARTCVAVGARLHLVEPLGFSIDARAVRRAGLDYWADLDLQVWPDLAQLMATLDPLAGTQVQSASSVSAGLFYLTTKASQVYTENVFPDRTILFFGKETQGLPQLLLQAHPERCLRIPMLPGRRSLNLSNAVAILVYEVLRQHGFADLQRYGPSIGQAQQPQTDRIT